MTLNTSGKPTTAAASMAASQAGGGFQVEHTSFGIWSNFINLNSRITLTSGGGDSAKATITGTDLYGNTITEESMGNAATATSTKVFKKCNFNFC